MLNQAIKAKSIQFGFIFDFSFFDFTSICYYTIEKHKFSNYLLC